MPRVRALLIALAFPFNALVAQPPDAVVPNERSTLAESARYEIVQSGLIARSTFRLDRVTGDTQQLAMTPDSSWVWQEVPRRSHPLPDTRIPGRPNYQLFMSGLAARYTFLLNVNTGAI